MRSLPFALYIVLLALNPVLAALLPSGFDPRWLYGVQVALVSIVLLVCWRHYDELRESPSPLALAAAVAVGLVVFALWIRLDFGPLVIGTPAGFDPTNAGSVRWDLALTRMAGAVLVVPVMEELFWRSFILRWLHDADFTRVNPRQIGWWPLLLSSALFATEHHLWFAGLLAGLAYGWLYLRTGTLWVPIAAHAVTNGVLGWWVIETGSWSFW